MSHVYELACSSAAYIWQAVWTRIGVPWFFVAIMLWEIVFAILRDDKPTRRQRRASFKPTLHTFPKNWLVLSALMLLPGVMQPASAQSFEVKAGARLYNLKRQYQLTSCTARAAVFSPNTLLEFNKMNYEHMQELFLMRSE